MRALLLVLALSAAPAQAAYDYRQTTDSFRHELLTASRVKLAERTDEALDRLVQHLTIVLERRGFTDEAAQFSSEWRESFKGYLPAIVAAAGDQKEVPEEYKPMSDWLSDWYHRLRDLLGYDVLHMTHIEDLQIFNWGTGLVLDLKAEMDDHKVDAARYEIDFDPWAGAISFWLVFIGCEAGCAAAGIVLPCWTFANMADRFVTDVMAPQISDRVWARVYTASTY